MLTLEKFEEASEIVKRVTRPTKLIYSEYLSSQTGGKVYLKPEQWDNKKLIVKNHPNADALNRLIYEFVATIEKKELELYIHIPFCVRKCNYCDFLSFPADEDTQRQYVKALCKEISYYGAHCRDYVVSTVYIGGGTPSWLWESDMAEIMDAVHKNFALLPDAEVSVECNPGTVTAQKFAVYRQSGINRISLGLQSAQNVELKMLGRIHTWEQFLKTYELARSGGFSNINVDLMSSLPGQHIETYADSLQKVCRLKPEHISAYSLIIEKGTPFYDLYKFDAVKQRAGMVTDALPTEDEVYEMTKLTEEMLKENGYVHYEVSNFAQPGYARPCRTYPAVSSILPTGAAGVGCLGVV